MEGGGCVFELAPWFCGRLVFGSENYISSSSIIDFRHFSSVGIIFHYASDSFINSIMFHKFHGFSAAAIRFHKFSFLFVKFIPQFHPFSSCLFSSHLLIVLQVFIVFTMMFHHDLPCFSSLHDFSSGFMVVHQFHKFSPFWTRGNTGRCSVAWTWAKGDPFYGG